ncbi:MAG: prepilin-type N-terminal cleavage/methylation domain-containing protein, partial [Lentisphaeraceae bacterium]|nr:prepilin-type N-terminal cleavage/methylation domain-containing protein [Lentisphaeraceae bacterium]
MNRAFTLLELLVVISIISILLSLTLPAVSRARNKIYSSVCTANLKSIGRAANVYSNDYDSFSMPASFG